VMVVDGYSIGCLSTWKQAVQWGSLPGRRKVLMGQYDMPAICSQCATENMVRSGGPGTKVRIPVRCSSCGNRWTCTVAQGGET